MFAGIVWFLTIDVRISAALFNRSGWNDYSRYRQIYSTVTSVLFKMQQWLLGVGWLHKFQTVVVIVEKL